MAFSKSKPLIDSTSLTSSVLLVRGYFPRLGFFADFLYFFIIILGIFVDYLYTYITNFTGRLFNKMGGGAQR